MMRGDRLRERARNRSFRRSAARTDLCDTGTVKGSEFLRKLRRLARRSGVRFQYEPSLGKGSHGRVWLETASTILKDPKKELGTGLLRDMCRDLRIDPRDL
jgi:mRNA interferase HicA